MAIQTVRVAMRPELRDPPGEDVLYEIRHALHIASVERVRTARVYRFEGISPEGAETLTRQLLAEQVFQICSVNGPVLSGADKYLEVAYKPGVMNPEAASLLKAARDLGIEGLVAADSSREYAFYGSSIGVDDLAAITGRLLVNATVEQVVSAPPRTLLIEGVSASTHTYPIRTMDDAALLDLSREKLFLNLAEMQAIKEYFTTLGRDPTDCEVEVIAQTWSEHCGHKTFKARIVVDGVEKKPLYERLKQATRQAAHPLVLSAFVDNAGVLAFYEGQAILGKVETHNSPSAIEPYGGAMTGSGGVFRDIMGTGRGAKVVASTDMFCFAPPDIAEASVPSGCLHPHYLLRRVVAGVRDYGNRMGIPTTNGSVHFHADFRAKPTVIVGAYGLMPASLSGKGEARPGDLGVVVGGRTGRDGIHGATFSSGAMTDRTVAVNASAVQIGHAIEEKRVSDALLVARDAGMIRALTDCGAGGFGSALGEMGAEVGVEVFLAQVPLKYSGLAPWEIFESESQERMVLAVDPADWDKLQELCRRFNVEATVIARFTGDGRLKVSYAGEMVCDLDMGFVHDGLPESVLEATWQNPSLTEPDLPPPTDWAAVYRRVMGHLNVCSKEPIVRRYDHGVQGAAAIYPYGGVEGDGPNDAALCVLLPGRPYAMVVSHGLNPVLNNIDPYQGALWAATEAVANAVAVGADFRELALIDNFIWPAPTAQLLGSLDRAVDALVDFVAATGMPFISGKDSLSSTFRGRGQTIEIPPVVCISCFGRVADVSRTVSADFKRAGSEIWLVGRRDTSRMAGSVYYDLHGVLGRNLPVIDPAQLPAVFGTLHRAIDTGAVLACHDIAEGGLAAALAEMGLGGGLGARVEMPSGDRPEWFLFNETPGCFLVELAPGTDGVALFAGIPAVRVGNTTIKETVEAGFRGAVLFELALDDLRQAYQKPMREVFGS
ncbi:MAG TPA: AIR synthase-related protein [Spirochaetia bacterium]|nr:AIR synthase-related protein [Spirochaetia bacterium]